MKELPSHLPYPTENSYYKIPILCLLKYFNTDTNYSMVEAALYEIAPKTRNLRNELKSFTVSDYRREFQNDYNIFSFCMPQLTNSMPIASWQDLIATYQTNPLVVLYYYNNHYRPYSHVSDSITQLARDKYFKIHEIRNNKKNLYTNY